MTWVSWTPHSAWTKSRPRGGNAAARSLNPLGENWGANGGARAPWAPRRRLQAASLPRAFGWIVHFKTWHFASLRLLITPATALRLALAHRCRLTPVNIDRWIAVSRYLVIAGSSMLSWLKERGSRAKSISSWFLNVGIHSHCLRDIFLWKVWLLN